MNDHGVPNNYQDQVFHNLNRQFAGRGIARVQSAGVRQSSEPLTLVEFTNKFRNRGVYSASVVSYGQARPVQRNPQLENRQRPVQNSAPNNNRQINPHMNAPVSNVQKRAAVKNAQPANAGSQRMPQTGVKPMPPRRNNNNTAVVKKNELLAVKTRKKSEQSELGKTFSQHVNSFVVSLRKVPVAAVFVCIICAVLLMSILGTKVMMGDASDGMIGVQNEISDLAGKNEELEIALERKNDLRVIEEIAINKLGMVKKDLVSRQYIKLNDEDVVETFEEEKNNIGIATLFSAITKGN